MNCNGHLDSAVDEQLTFEEVGTDADSCNSSSMEGSSAFSRLSTKWREPIVVGYAFGPKKMRSMGVVMAEASRVKVIHEVPEEEEEEEGEEFEDGEEADEKDTHTVVGGYSPGPSTCLNASRQCHERAPSTLTSDALQDLGHVESTTYSHLQNKTSSPLGSTVITLRNSNESSDLRHIVRCFRSNCSSAAESLASMSETSGSTTLVSLNNNSSCSNRRPRKTRFPILISFVPLDLDQPLEDQHGGNFDLILHKLTEDILSCSLQQNSYEATTDAAEIVDDQSRKRVEALQDYYKRNQHCCLVDNPRNVQTVMSRSDIADVLRRCLRNVTSTSGVPVRSPLFVVIPNCDDPKKRANDLKIALQEETQGLSTPLIVKPLIAAGTKESHCMLIALHETAFVKLPPKTIVQEYVNHDATLYKIYVLGDFVSVYERHSLPNLPDDLSTATVDLVEFDSQRPYPNLRDFVHNMDETDRSPKDTKFRNAVAVTVEEVTPVVRALKKAFGLELFGFDILRRSGDKEWLVVDVNYFPSYKEVPNFPSLLARYLTRRVLEQRRKGNDSG